MPTGVYYHVRRCMQERFWEKVDKNGPVFRPELGRCWLWTGATNKKNGYGSFALSGGVARVTAHVTAWKLLRGEVPQGLELDHLCRTPLCVNPEHLEPVTHKENLRRGMGVTSLNAQKTHCPKGHALSGENLVIEKTVCGTGRKCRTCKNARRRKHGN